MINNNKKKQKTKHKTRLTAAWCCSGNIKINVASRTSLQLTKHIFKNILATQGMYQKITHMGKVILSVQTIIVKIKLSVKH